MFGVSVNVGSSSSNPNRRGRVFDNYECEFLPIPEVRKTSEQIPTYKDLGFDKVKFPDLQVHSDPEFRSCTYGHVRRGFGDLENLLKLEREDCLLFHATLEKQVGWSTYVIGYFRNLNVLDCRKLSPREIFDLKSKGFENCAHLKRTVSHADLLVKGGTGSRQLKKAFPLAEESDHLAVAKKLQDLVLTSSGKKIKPGAPWFRWTLTCRKADRLLEMINSWQSL